MEPYLLRKAVRKLDERMPEPSEEVSAASERAALFELFDELLSNLPPSNPPEPPTPSEPEASLYVPLIDFSVQRYERAINLERMARQWFEGQGGEVLQNPRGAAVDFIVRYNQDAEAVEVKSSRSGNPPTPEFLRDLFLRARIWVDEHLGTDGRFLSTLVTDVVPPPNLLDRFRDQGLGLVHIDPETEKVSIVLQPTNRRE